MKISWWEYPENNCHANTPLHLTGLWWDLYRYCRFLGKRPHFAPAPSLTDLWIWKHCVRYPRKRFFSGISVQLYVPGRIPDLIAFAGRKGHLPAHGLGTSLYKHVIEMDRANKIKRIKAITTPRIIYPSHFIQKWVWKCWENHMKMAWILYPDVRVPARTELYLRWSCTKVFCLGYKNIGHGTTTNDSGFLKSEIGGTCSQIHSNIVQPTKNKVLLPIIINQEYFLNLHKFYLPFIMMVIFASGKANEYVNICNTSIVF